MRLRAVIAKTGLVLGDVNERARQSIQLCQQGSELMFQGLRIVFVSENRTDR